MSNRPGPGTAFGQFRIRMHCGLAILPGKLHRTRCEDKCLGPLMETLGHSHISVTMNLYGHVEPVVQREVADRMGGILAAREHGVRFALIWREWP